MPLEASYETEDAYVSVASKRMRQVYSLVKDQLQVGYDPAKRCYMMKEWTPQNFRKAILCSTSFQDQIKKGLKKKWLPSNKGPYHIIRQINDVNVIVHRSPESQPEIVHIDSLADFMAPFQLNGKKVVVKEKTTQENQGSKSKMVVKRL